MKGRPTINSVVLVLLLASSARLSVEAQSHAMRFSFGDHKDLSTAVAMRTDFTRLQLERHLRVAYSLLLQSFLKRMDRLLFMPVNHLQELFLGYFSILLDKRMISECVYDNLHHFLIRFVNSNPDLYFFELLPKFLIRLRMDKLLKSPEFDHFYRKDGSYIQFETRRDLRAWLKRPDEELDALAKSHISKFRDQNLEFFSLLVSGLSSYLSRQREHRNIEGLTLLDEYLDRLAFLKITNPKFNSFFREVLVENISNFDSLNLSEDLERLSNSFLESYRSQNWSSLEQQFEEKYWAVSKSNKESLLNYVDFALLNNPSIVSPNFRNYYILKFKDLISQLDEERQTRFFESPEKILSLLKRDFFPRFNKVECFLSSFRLFTNFLGLPRTQALEKSFDAYSYELKSAALVDDETERRLNEEVRSAIQNRRLKITAELSDSLLDRILPDCPNVFLQNILCLIGVTHDLTQQIRFHSRVFWKRYYEFYNLRKPAVIPFNLKVLIEIIKRYTKTRGVYTLRSIVSHYADNLEAISMLKSSEKHYFIRIMLGILFRGYIRAGRFNFRLALKRYQDHIVKLLHEPPKQLVARTKTFGGSPMSFEDGMTLTERLKAQMKFFEKIQDHNRKVIRKPFGSWARNYLRQNYRFRTHLDKELKNIIEKIRDSVIPRLPKELETIKSPLDWHALLSQINPSHQVRPMISPILERIRENENKPKGHEFGLALFECFRENFNSMKFSSWLSLQLAFKKYLNSLEDVRLTPAQLSIIEQLLDNLRPFYSDGNLNYAKFLASFPDEVEIIDEQGNPRKNILQLLRDYKTDSASNVAWFWSKFVRMAASFFDSNGFNQIREFPLKLLLSNSLSTNDYPAKTNEELVKIFSRMEEELKNSSSSEESNKQSQKKLLIHFFLETPFESLVKAKSILATAKRLFLHDNCRLYAEVFVPNQRIFSDILGYETFTNVKQLLESYTSQELCQVSNVYRPSDHEEIKEKLHNSTKLPQSDIQIMINLFHKFSKTLLVMSPFTSARLKSSLNGNLQFCTHSQQKLNMLYERVKINEKVGLKEAQLKYLKHINMKSFKLAQKSKQAFNLFKVLFFAKRHTTLHEQTRWASFLNGVISTIENSRSIGALRKRLVKFLDNTSPQHLYFDRKSLSSICIQNYSAGPNNHPQAAPQEIISAVRKRIFKFFEEGTKYSLFTRQFMPSLLEEDLSHNRGLVPSSVKKHLFKTLVTDVVKKMAAARGNNLMHAMVENQKSNSLTQTLSVIRKKLLKFLPTEVSQVSKLTKYVEAANGSDDSKFKLSVRKNLIKYLGLLKKLKSEYSDYLSEGQSSELTQTAKIGSIRKILLKSLASLNQANMRVSKHLNGSHSETSTNVSGENKEKSGAVATSVRKRVFKFLPVGITQITSFMQSARVANSFISSALDLNLRKRLFKYLQIVDKMNSQYLDYLPFGQHSQSSDEAKIGAIRKILLKNLAQLNQVKMNVLKQMNARLSESSTNIGEKDGNKNIAVVSSIRKSVLKFLDVLKKIKMSAVQLLAANFSEQSTNTSSKGNKSNQSHIGVVRKKLLKFFSFLPKMKLSMVQYFDPRLSLIDNSLSSSDRKGKGAAVHSVAKRLFKFLLIKNSPQMDYFVNKRASDFLKGFHASLTSGMASKLLHFVPSQQKEIFMQYLRHIKALMATLKVESPSENSHKGLNFKAKLLKYVPKEHLMDMTVQKTLKMMMKNLKPIAEMKPVGFEAKLYHFIGKLHEQALLKTSLFSGKMNQSQLKKSFDRFKTQLIKNIAVETAMSMGKTTSKNVLQSTGAIQSAGLLNNFHSVLLKRKSLLTEVMLTYLRSRINSSALQKIKNDSILRAITFKSILQNVEQRLKFMKFVRKYILRNSIIKPKINSLSTKILFKRLESTETEQNFLAYLRQNQDPSLVDKLMRLSRVPNSRVKFKRIIKLFNDMHLKSQKKEMSPLDKMRRIYHNFIKQSVTEDAPSNQLEKSESNLKFITFVDRLIQLMRNDNEFGRVRMPVSKPPTPPSETPEETIVCCTCCCQESDSAVDGEENKNCDCAKKQAEVNDDPSFIQRASQMVNIDPIVNIHLRVKGTNGQFIEKEAFVLNSRSIKGRQLQLEADQFIEASSTRLI